MNIHYSAYHNTKGLRTYTFIEKKNVPSNYKSTYVVYIHDIFKRMFHHISMYLFTEIIPQVKLIIFVIHSITFIYTGAFVS